jgi:membrane-bound lytic murein transglycosylase B
VSQDSKGLMTWQRATALVPLALLSAGWTASLASPTTASASGADGRLPDGTEIPREAVEAPASVTQPGVIAPGVPKGSADAVVSGASANGIPAAALSAYQRAAQVIQGADQSCRLDWTLIAAIGRVESDHGRYGNNTLSDSGVSRPGIYGIPLDGRSGTTQIDDTDAGELDDDPVFDRAVGPMQFIPSTWSVVGVDGDGDGVRNPQDIDDAALATAVYLCSGDEDLSTTSGQRAAVYRYNHSQRYVDLVLAIMRAYADGDFSSVPNGSASPATFSPKGGDAPAQGPRGPRGNGGGGAAGGGGSGGGDKGDKGGGGGGGAGTPAPTPTPAPPPSGGGGGTGGGGTGGGGGGLPTAAPTPAPPPPVEPVVETLDTLAEATTFCANELAGITNDSTVINQCAQRVVGKTVEEAAALIPNTLAAVLSWLGLPSLPGLGGGGGGLLG